MVGYVNSISQLVHSSLFMIWFYILKISYQFFIQTYKILQSPCCDCRRVAIIFNSLIQEPFIYHLFHSTISFNACNILVKYSKYRFNDCTAIINTVNSTKYFIPWEPWKLSLKSWNQILITDQHFCRKWEKNGKFWKHSIKYICI